MKRNRIPDISCSYFFNLLFNCNRSNRCEVEMGREANIDDDLGPRLEQVPKKGSAMQLIRNDDQQLMWLIEPQDELLGMRCSRISPALHRNKG